MLAQVEAARHAWAAVRCVVEALREEGGVHYPDQSSRRRARCCTAVPTGGIKGLSDTNKQTCCDRSLRGAEWRCLVGGCVQIRSRPVQKRGLTICDGRYRRASAIATASSLLRSITSKECPSGSVLRVSSPSCSGLLQPLRLAVYRVQPLELLAMMQALARKKRGRMVLVRRGGLGCRGGVDQPRPCLGRSRQSAPTGNRVGAGTHHSR